MHYSNHNNRLFRKPALLLLPVFILLLATSAFAQVSDRGPVITFGNMPAGANAASTVCTYDQLLSNTHFVCPPGYKITRFTLSFQSKGMDFIGPYVIHGDSLRKQEIGIINKLRAQQPTLVKMYMEDVKVLTPENVIRTYANFIFTIK